VLRSLYVDRESEEEDQTLSAAFGGLAHSPRMLTLAREHASFSEFVAVNGRMFAIGVAQITRSDGSGTPAGYVMMASELTDAAVSEALQADAHISQSPRRARVETDDAWQIQAPINDARGQPIASIAFEVPRAISKLGAVTLMSAFAAGAALLAGVLIAVLFMLRLLVVNRLERVTAHVAEVAASRELKALEPDARGDELGSLNASFNDMIAQLKDLREQVEAQSFELGQADLAAGVMHNVRNSLNPVSVILSRALAETAPVRKEDVLRAISELAGTETEPQRRARLVAFLLEGFEEADRRCASNREALSTAKGSLVEALDILKFQNPTVQAALTLERFDLLELIRRNVASLQASGLGAVAVELPDTSIEVTANRLLLSQVVANLLTNAYEAIAAKSGGGRIMVSLGASAGGAIKITIADDGAGFDPAIHAELFRRGYSTKQVRSGLGLHWCANTIASMGGTLALESDGKGKGARATISLSAAAATKPAPAATLAA
jgi:two-component system, OmpR family, sensor kinase